MRAHWLEIRVVGFELLRDPSKLRAFICALGSLVNLCIVSFANLYMVALVQVRAGRKSQACHTN